MSCKLCSRNRVLTEHHLIPKVLHKKYRKKKYKREVLQKTISICRDCHNHVHNLYTNKELAREYNTIELLQESQAIQKFIKFIRKRG